MTFGDWLLESGAVGRAMREKVVGPGDVVAMLPRRSTMPWRSAPVRWLVPWSPGLIIRLGPIEAAAILVRAAPGPGGR